MRRLEDMAVSTDPKLRAIAAAHPRLQPQLLLLRLMDPDASVRRAAVKNPAITYHLLEVALKDEDLGIAAYARLMMEEENDE